MITVDVNIPCSKFDILYNLPKDVNIVVCIGGRGGMKTYEVSKFVAYSACIKNRRCVVLRDEKETIRESILNEILMRYDTADESGLLSTKFERLSTGIKDKTTDEMMVFTKGFRASDGQKKANLKSISNVDIAVIEEAEDIRDVDKFNTFADSIRKEGSLIIIILNTPDINHWIVKRYFNCINVDGQDGFFDIVPKDIPGFVCIKTGFEDNPFLPTHVVNNYRAYGDPTSHLYNPFYYMTAIMGYASTGRKGQILTKVKPIKLADYMKLPFKEFYGQDFGTASPAGMVGVKFDKNNCYCRQINYNPMNAIELGKLYCQLKLTPGDKIIADSADPDTIKKLKNGWPAVELPQDIRVKYPGLMRGFYVVPAVKGQNSIKYGISLMDSMNLFAVEESTDLWNEIFNWVYAQDKNGNYIDDPIDDFNHLIDPWRYVIMDQRGKKELFGI